MHVTTNSGFLLNSLYLIPIEVKLEKTRKDFSLANDHTGNHILA